MFYEALAVAQYPKWTILCEFNGCVTVLSTFHVFGNHGQEEFNAEKKIFNCFARFTHTGLHLECLN